MRREVIDDITLSDGTRLRKGSEFMVSAMSHWDPSLYTNPEEWDGMRFYRLRQQQGNENASQAVITSAEHLVSPHLFFPLVSRLHLLPASALHRIARLVPTNTPP